MAISAATKTTDFSGYLDPHMAQPYFDEVAKTSVVQRLARKVPLGISGEKIPIVTTKPKAGWVAEGERKPATKSGLGLVTMAPHKIAAIAVVSAEVVRANPGNYVSIYRRDIAEAFALAFDAAVLHGTDTPFDHYLDETSKSVKLGATAADKGGVYGDAVAALKTLTDDKKKLTGWAFDLLAEPLLAGSTDTTGRPLLVDPVYTGSAMESARLLGRQVFMGDGVATEDKTSVVGYGGDWSKCVWGAIGGISYDVTTQASVTIGGELVSLWEHNLVGILAEAEFGFAVAEEDLASFVRLTNTQ